MWYNRRIMNGQIKILHASGGYHKLIAYDKSDVICQATNLFCRRFMPKFGDRTVDQMIQAARSCKQNIVEGSEAAGTNLETQLKLTNVARASLGELLQDYIDYLKFHKLPRWDVKHPRTPKLRQFAKENSKWEGWEKVLASCDDEVFCNSMITVISQTMHLLKKLIAAQEEDFRENGGIRERMTAARIGRRQSQNEEIEKLKSENVALRAENSELKAENDRLRAAVRELEKLG